MPECDTRWCSAGQVDAATLIDAKVNAVIAAARTAVGPAPGRVLQRVYETLGAPLSSNPFSDDYNKSGIEKWLESLPPTVVFPLTQNMTKYNGVTYRVWPNTPGGASRILEPTMLVNGTWIGADKLGHFMQQGFQYYELVAKLKISLREAQQWGHEMEATGGWSPDSLLSMNPYGLASTGVYSLADQEANLQGYRFYSWLRWAPTTPFSIASYISSKWNEEASVNSYHEELAPVVWNNLLAARWTGNFTIKDDPHNPNIYVVANLTPGTPSIDGTTLTGRFNYTYNAGPVNGALNANVQYIPFITTDLGYRGIRIDYSWRSGQNVGRGVWRSDSTENRLLGSWGRNTSTTDGGRFDLQRNP
jgi:hypothetical protein